MNLLLVTLFSFAVLPGLTAQEPRAVTLAQVLSGSVVPLTLNPKDLAADFKAIEVRVSGAEAAPIGPKAPSQAIVGGPKDAADALRALNALYTGRSWCRSTGRPATSPTASTRPTLGALTQPSPARAAPKVAAPEGGRGPLDDPLGRRPLLLSPLVAAIQRRREDALRRIRELGLAALRYASDHEDDLPYVQSSPSALAAFFPYLRLRTRWLLPRRAAASCST